MKHASLVDLIAISAIALLASIAMLLDIHNSVIRVALGLPIVLVLPGYAVLEALFPDQHLSSLERLVLVPGLSISITVLSGLVLHITPWGLQALSWILLLSGVVFFGSVVAAMRRHSGFDLALPQIEFKRLDAFLLGLALIVLVAAGAVATNAAQYRYTPEYASLWMLPLEDGENSVRVGLRNGSWPATYTLRVRAGEEIIREWSPLALEEEQEWEVTVSVPANIKEGDAVEALLFLEDQLVEPVRHVNWWIGNARERGN
jgi:hypothetical protein